MKHIKLFEEYNTINEFFGWAVGGAVAIVFLKSLIHAAMAKSSARSLMEVIQDILATKPNVMHVIELEDRYFITFDDDGKHDSHDLQIRILKDQGETKKWLEDNLFVKFPGSQEELSMRLAHKEFEQMIQIIKG